MSEIQPIIKEKQELDICIATGIYPPIEGGPSSLSYELARKITATGNNITVITFNPDFKMSYESNGHLSILKLPQPKLGKGISFNPIRFSFKILIFLLGLLVLKPLKRFKLIHSMDHSLAGIPSLIFTIFYRIQLVVRFPADWLFHAIDERGWQKSALKSQIVSILQNIMLKSIKRIIVTNNYVFGMLRSFNVPKEKIVIIPNAVDTNRFMPPTDKIVIKRRVGFKENQIIILSVCRLHPSKRLEDLIYAVVETRKMLNQDIQLLIVGSGPDLTRLKRISKLTGFNNKITFLGRISNEEIHTIYQTADLFVLPSAHETFGIVILEAMASGIPVILARSGGISSIFIDQQSCIMFEPGDRSELKNTLHQLIVNTKMRKTLAERARKIVDKHYSWKSVAQQTLSLYKSFLEHY